ncbi:MAG: STAS domain-containing protein, partial [Pseudonocardia sp.]|nr:STAS domain-containing protein [Pseudonocardia sp.]
MVGLREHATPRETGIALPPPRARLQSVGPPGRPGRSPASSPSVPPESATPELDVRLHTPRAEVVVVRVAGAVDERGADLLEERIGQQLARARHVVVDLSEVPDLPACGTRALADLARDAHRHGT